MYHLECESVPKWRVSVPCVRSGYLLLFLAPSVERMSRIFAVGRGTFSTPLRLRRCLFDFRGCCRPCRVLRSIIHDRDCSIFAVNDSFPTQVGVKVLLRNSVPNNREPERQSNCTKRFFMEVSPMRYLRCTMWATRRGLPLAYPTLGRGACTRRTPFSPWGGLPCR